MLDRGHSIPSAKVLLLFVKGGFGGVVLQIGVKLVLVHFDMRGQRFVVHERVIIFSGASFLRSISYFLF
jgi:hypothetical protein